VETIPLEIAKELNLSITLFWGIKPILSFFSIPTLLFIGGSSDGWHISVTKEGHNQSVVSFFHSPVEDGLRMF
jgi:hypothetical protein